MRVMGVSLNGVFERTLGLGRQSWLFLDVVTCLWGVGDEKWIVWAVEREGLTLWNVGIESLFLEDIDKQTLALWNNLQSLEEKEYGVLHRQPAKEMVQDRGEFLGSRKGALGWSQWHLLRILQILR